MMVQKLCTNCGKTCWHNSKPDGGYRCTYCAYPAGTGPKMEKHNAIMRIQVAKPK